MEFICVLVIMESKQTHKSNGIERRKSLKLFACVRMREDNVFYEENIVNFRHDLCSLHFNSKR